MKEVPPFEFEKDAEIEGNSLNIFFKNSQDAESFSQMLCVMKRAAECELGKFDFQVELYRKEAKVAISGNLFHALYLMQDSIPLKVKHWKKRVLDKYPGMWANTASLRKSQRDGAVFELVRTTFENNKLMLFFDNTREAETFYALMKARKEETQNDKETFCFDLYLGMASVGVRGDLFLAIKLIKESQLITSDSFDKFLDVRDLQKIYEWQAINHMFEESAINVSTLTPEKSARCFRNSGK